jgi:gliding motility-associated-like protein
MYTEILKAENNCDSIVTIELTVLSKKFTTLDTSICEGGMLVTPQQSYSVEGIYTERYKAQNTCDSIVTIQLSVRKIARKTIDTTLCFGTAYTSLQNSYTQPGTYTEIYQAVNKCDSIVTINLTFDPKIETTYNKEICEGEIFNTPQKTYNTAGSYTEIYQAVNKCDSIVTINLKINPTISTSYSREICQGETFNTPKGTYTSSGSFTELYQSIKGCDSTVTFQLIVHPLKNTTLDTTLCEGEILITPIASYSKAGTYTEVYQTSKNCDSTVTINLSIIEKGDNLEYITICEGESYRGYTSSGTYKETRTSGSGCAANFTIFLTVLPKIRKTIDTSICFGATYTSPKGTYSVANKYTEIYTAANGCDSIVTINLNIDPNITSSYTKEICQGNAFTTAQKTYDKAGIYTEVYKTLKGCDSTVTINLTILPLRKTIIDTSICQGLTFKSYTTSGTYTEIYTAVNGCDSTVIINLTVKPTFVTNLTKTICEGDSFKGYTLSGTYTESYTAINGCDSIVRVFLTVLKKSFVEYDKTICIGENFRGYTTPGTFIETFTAANGCDSIVTTRLSVVSRDTLYETKTICEGETHRGFTESGNYRVAFTNQNGCESILYVNLTVLKKSYLNITQSICEGQSFMGYTQSGIYTQKHMAANGCDSIVTIDLRVTPKQNKIIRVDICEGSTHRGYTETGVYTELYTAENGCDSIVTTILTVRPHTRSEIYQTICEGQQLDGYAESGIYTDTLLNRWGCDSIRVLHLTVEKKMMRFFEATICEGEQYQLPNGKWVAKPGVYTDTLRTRFGCDSLIRTTTLVIKPGPIFTVSKSNDINCLIARSQLTVTGGIRYQWTPISTLDTPNIATPVATPDKTTTYTVRVWGANGCSFAKDITVYTDFNGDGPRYPIPSAFTPNKDGLNDCFHVRHWGAVQNFKMDIYNRWGEKIFSSNNIQSCWDGTFNKLPLPTGVFVYKISANGPCGNMFRTGTVTLIR